MTCTLPLLVSHILMRLVRCPCSLPSPRTSHFGHRFNDQDGQHFWSTCGRLGCVFRVYIAQQPLWVGTWFLGRWLHRPVICFVSCADHALHNRHAVAKRCRFRLDIERVHCLVLTTHTRYSTYGSQGGESLLERSHSDIEELARYASAASVPEGG
jgi:hypothetical protein